jgi:hypothetical protein
MMISGIGGGGMPAMGAMRQMQQKMFGKADADASGGLDAAEFGSMMKSRPMGGRTPDGLSADDAFKKIDGDGNGNEQDKSGRASSNTDDLANQLRSLIDKLSSTYVSVGGGRSAGLSFRA